MKSSIKKTIDQLKAFIQILEYNLPWDLKEGDKWIRPDKSLLEYISANQTIRIRPNWKHDLAWKEIWWDHPMVWIREDDCFYLVTFMNKEGFGYGEGDEDYCFVDWEELPNRTDLMWSADRKTWHSFLNISAQIGKGNLTTSTAAPSPKKPATCVSP